MTPKKPTRLDAGFTNQQAVFVLILFFPLGLVAIGLMLALAKRTPTALSPAPLSTPSQPSPTIPSPVPTAPTAVSNLLNESQARAVVEQWLSMKSQIFAPPFDTNLAGQIVAAGPLWTDLTKTDGSIDWLKKNNSYYTYNFNRINSVSQFTPSDTIPTIVVSITEDSVLHSPNGTTPSVKTSNWLYMLKQEDGTWKVWDYRKQ